MRVADSASKGHVEPVAVFFDDLDAFGMVYHGRFAALLEHGLAAYFARLGLSAGHEDYNVVVRELTITFEHPITEVGTVDLAFWVESFGRTSAKYGFRFQNRKTVYAHGHRTIIKVDPNTKCPAPWTEATRHLLTDRLLVPGGQVTSK